MHAMKVYGTATVGIKGQIVIPADARHDLHLKNGDKVFVMGARDGHMIGLCPLQDMDAWLETMRQQLNDMKNAMATAEEEA